MEQGMIDLFVNAIKQEPNDKKTTYSAIVSRIDEEGVIWVYVAGSDKDTPTAQTGVEVKKGDNVTVEWRNNKLYIAGNYSNPSAGMARVQEAETAAKVANEAADNAVYDAGRARDAAEQAQGKAAEADSAARNASQSAQEASDSAHAAITDLSLVEKVVDSLEWIARHGYYSRSDDQEVYPDKMYFTLECDAVATPTGNPSLQRYYERYGSGTDEDPYYYVKTEDTSVASGKTYYTGSASSVSQPTGNPYELLYYELKTNEAVSQYLNSHLALTNNGLYIIAEDNSYKALLSSTGLQIIDPQGHVVGIHGDIIQLGQKSEIHFEATSNQLKFCTQDEDICWFGQNAYGIWEMHIANTFVEDMVRYGDYAFIKRKNGNMSLKWLGA